MSTDTTAAPSPDEADLTASDVAWDLSTLLDGRTTDELLDQAESLTVELEAYRGRLAELDAAAFAGMMQLMARLWDCQGRVGGYTSLTYTENVTDPAAQAAMMAVQERLTPMATRLVFIEIEFAELDDDHVERLLADPVLDFCAHHLRGLRKFRPHLLTEAEERVLTEKSVSGSSAWVRLFDELTSSVQVELPGALVGSEDPTATVALEQGLALLQHPDREVRRTAALAVTDGLEPGLRTRAYVFNTLLLDKRVDDGLRHYDSWISSRNLANEASDESVAALVEAVQSRYDLPQRWYSLKAQVLGVPVLADYDRMASVAADESQVGWDEARTTVLAAYRSFSPEL
ncbi:MAG: oligoendopeptidase, partial [Actinomycetes bacterium]